MIFDPPIILLKLTLSSNFLLISWNFHLFCSVLFSITISDGKSEIFIELLWSGPKLIVLTELIRLTLKN